MAIKYQKLILPLFIINNLFAQSNRKDKPDISNWNVNPFEQKVFIENNSQFDGRGYLKDSRILFGLRDEGIEIFFSLQGLTYRHRKQVEISEDKREKKERAGQIQKIMTPPIDDSLSMEWLNSNPNAEIISEEPVNNYFTYSDLKDPSGRSSIKANAFKKITYKNLYPRIDVEYTFPANKKGVKYNIILHPGADPSQIKMSYSTKERIRLNTAGDLLIPYSSEYITDHAPNTIYKMGGNVNSFFKVDNNIISFNIDKNYDHSQTLIIDPWTTTPTFAGTTKAFDVDYDLAGNVYIYGGKAPFQEIKLNPAGVIQWTYTGPCPFSEYGDFTVDGKTQVSYIVDGYVSWSAGGIHKVGPTGLPLVNYSPYPNYFYIEFWRVVYNQCTHRLVIAGGSDGYTYNGFIVDTSFATFTAVNVLGGSTPYLDMSLLAIDNANNAYLASCRSNPHPASFDNKLMKVPASSLTPKAYIVSDGHAFKETGHMLYNYPSGSTHGIGFNGMAVSTSFLYTYDGTVLKKWNPASGTLIGTVAVTPATSFKWSGITVDACDHIFVGAVNSIKQYDVNLSLVNTFAAADTVYDLKLGPGNILYACGRGFVSAMPMTLPSCTPITATSNCSSNSAEVVSVPGIAPYTYSWSTAPVQTTQIATGLSSGWYYVTITDNSCTPLIFKDSIQIIGSGSLNALMSAPNNVKCNLLSNGSVGVTVSGGSTPYTYSWSNGASSITNSTTHQIINLTPGNYSVTVTDASGCISTAMASIISPPPITAQFTKGTGNCAGCGCKEWMLVTASGGTSPYSYSWPDGYINRYKNQLCPGTYNIAVKDKNGCSININLTAP